ncbi:MAG: DedA family protein [Cyanobacteria bacterium CRU_2_1]|nr:DedA family protein [Cyanobacteria bacterium RU_5_0]NJR61163.1 DedA family protein [Cyanobacteria bacterium CRU_2_1]
MSELISLDTIQKFAHEYGYWTVFLGILLENTGIPIPGETITLVGGFLAGNGELKYWWVLGTAIAGAVLGDNFGYWIGYFGGWILITRLGRLFRIREEQLIEVREQFAENAAKAVFWGRFIALLRIFAGPLAGTARMPYPKFLICNLAGAAIWASIMVSLAYFAGKLVPLEQLIAWVARFAFVALAIVAIWVAVSYWLDRRAKFSSQLEQQD